MPAHTASMTAGRALRPACPYQPSPYVLLRRSADDVPPTPAPEPPLWQAAWVWMKGCLKR